MKDGYHIGRNVETGEHVFMSQDVLDGHGAVQGGTGSIKSTIVSYLACRIIRKRPDAIVDVTDFGNDPAAFHRVKTVRELTGRHIGIGRPAESFHAAIGGMRR